VAVFYFWLGDIIVDIFRDVIYQISGVANLLVM
jgi:hypothetical protein